jgi:hypothetical protein
LITTSPVLITTLIVVEKVCQETKSSWEFFMNYTDEILAVIYLITCISNVITFNHNQRSLSRKKDLIDVELGHMDITPRIE